MYIIPLSRSGVNKNLKEEPKMTNWIEKVSFDGTHFLGGIQKQDLPSLKEEYRSTAVKVLEQTDADRVVYCHVAYSEDGTCTQVHFYRGLPMDGETFYERTGIIPGTDLIGAVYKHK